jgi:hypothetical protein
VVQLVDVGSHSGGTICRDGRRYATGPLAAAVDRLCRGFDGFYFGRVDLRAPDSDALAEGRDLRVLEVNGVTSEATHIYDPAVTVVEAYRVLFEQWRLAFEIGAANRERGIAPLTIGAFLALVVRYRRRRSAAEPGAAPPALW